MNLTVSTPVKVFALVAVLAGFVLMGGMMLLGPSTDDASYDTFVPPKPKATKSAVAPLEPTAAKASAAKTPAKAKVATAATPAKAATPTKPAAKTAAPAKPKPVAKPKPARVVASNGLPASVMAALADHPVVVLSLVDSSAKIDPMSRDEAQAGARTARAGYVELDVLRDQKAAEALMLKFGFALRSPAVYIFTRPGQVAVELKGYRDRDTVAQAALNALR